MRSMEMQSVKIFAKREAPNGNDHCPLTHEDFLLISKPPPPI
jgi:hypothetical protein